MSEDQDKPVQRKPDDAFAYEPLGPTHPVAWIISGIVLQAIAALIAVLVAPNVEGDNRAAFAYVIAALCGAAGTTVLMIGCAAVGALIALDYRDARDAD